MRLQIPVIDIAALASGDATARLRVAAEVGAACRGVGFFAVVGHGVPAALVADAFAASRAFFALDAVAKRALAIGKLGHNRGYVDLGVEALDETRGADQKEAFNLIWTDEHTRPPNAWPPIDGWRPRVQAYFDAVLAAARRLHIAFAIDLGRPKTTSTTASTSRSRPCACCTTRRPMRARRGRASVPARTPTTATSPCSPPMASPACRCARAKATGSMRPACPAPSSATSAIA